MDADSTPGWATGPDCFEDEAQQRAVEESRKGPIAELIDAYYQGELHLLAHAIRDFRTYYKMLFAEQLEDLEAEVQHLIHIFDQKTTGRDFPIPDAMKDGHQTH